MEDNSELIHFYKFRSTSPTDWPFVERIFTHSELYFARPSQFNDPFDCYPVVSLSATDSEYAAYLEDLYKRFAPHLSRHDRRSSIRSVIKDPSLNHSSQLVIDTMHDSVRRAVESAGVLSLSADPTPVLMWSHYANSHKGICLRFKATPHLPFFGRAQPVTYHIVRPVINLIRDSGRELIDKAVLTKADFWSYEDEWRVIEHDLGAGVHCFPQEALDGVLFGAKCDVDCIKKVKSLLEDRKVELLQVCFSEKDFRIHFEPLQA